MYVILLIRKSFSHECIQKSEDELASFIGTKLHLSLESAIIYKLDKKLNKTLWKKAYSDPKWCLRNYMSSLKIKNKNINFIVEKLDWCMGPDVAKWTDIEYNLDSLGNKINETIIPSFSKLELHGDISIDSTSRLYYGDKLLGVAGSNYYFKTNIIKADDKNNAIWNKVISDTSWRTGIKMGFKAKNNDIILVGNTIAPTLLSGKYPFKYGVEGVGCTKTRYLLFHFLTSLKYNLTLKNVDI